MTELYSISNLVLEVNSVIANDKVISQKENGKKIINNKIELALEQKSC